MNLLVPKSYKLKHEILSALISKTDNLKYRPEGFSEDEWCMPEEEVCKIANVNKDELQRNISLLYTRKELIITPKNKIRNFVITQEGITAYNEKNYLKEGQKKRLNSIKELSTWIIAVTSLVISLYTCNKK